MARQLLLFLPALAVAIVLWAVLGAVGSEPVLSVQVLGGPTRGHSELSLLVRALATQDGRRTPRAALRLHLTGIGPEARAEWTGSTDETGHAEARLAFTSPLTADPWLRVQAVDTGQLLGEGVLSLDAEEWQVGALRQGGWIAGQSQGELRVRVAPRQGALAVPFASELVVQVSSSTPAEADPGDGDDAANALAPARGVRLSFELEGAELMTPPPVLTDARGAAQVRLRPLEHAISLRITAQAAEGGEGQWFGALPVVPGALHVNLEGPRLIVRSPIPRSHAYVSLVSERERLGGTILALDPEAEGGATGSVELEPALLARAHADASWGVVSSEPDKRSPGVVGWPLDTPRQAGGVSARQTFDVWDRVLLDGTAAALESHRRTRFRQRGIAALLLVGVGIAMCALLWYEVQGKRSRAVRRADTDASSEIETRGRGWVLGAALACIGLGIAALAYFVTFAR
jgi:hypothetical protein